MGTLELEQLEITRSSISNFNSLVSCSTTRRTLTKYLHRTTGLPFGTCFKYLLEYYGKTDINESIFNVEIKEVEVADAD